MPHLYIIDSYTVRANDSLELQVAWVDGYWGRNRGPVLFRAIPVPPQNGFLLKPIWVTAYGMTANTIPYVTTSVGYTCKVRNDNPIAVEFVLELLAFDDIGVTSWPDNWKDPAKVSAVEQMKNLHEKITIITDNAGKIVGTAIHNNGSGPDEAEPILTPGPDQMVHVIDLPKELQGIQDVDELYKKLESHLKQGASK